MVWSDDAGTTWQGPRDISQEFGPASGSLPGPGAILVLPPTSKQHAGRMLFPLHHGAYHEDYVALSDDGGASWNVINQVSTPYQPKPTRTLRITVLGYIC